MLDLVASKDLENSFAVMSIRGAITKKNGKIWEKFPKGGGGLKKQTKIPNFNLGI